MSGPASIRLYNQTGAYVELVAGADASNSTVTLPDGFPTQNGYRYAGTRYYTSSGTFEKADPLGTGDIGLRAVKVRMVGGGGGGAGSPATGAGEAHCGASGSGAAYAETFIVNIAGLLTTETVTVGAGGAGGTAVSANGTDGQASSFGSIVSASGGQGGFSQGTSYAITGYPGVSGQSIATGDLVITGGASGMGIVSPAAFSISGNGGSTPLGGGAQGIEQWGSGGKDGQDAEGWGGGGSGSINGPNSAARSGGDGKAGIVIVECYV